MIATGCTGDYTSAGYLTGTSTRLFHAMRQLETMPTQTEIATHLRLMQRALTRFGALSQGLTATADPVANPDWLETSFDGIGTQPDPIAQLHPVLQRTIHSANEPQPTGAATGEEYLAQTRAFMVERDQMRVFFELLPGALAHLERAARHADTLSVLISRERPKGAPGDPWVILPMVKGLHK
ncbi:hypothetical protein [Paracoccus ravus]|uniref:hypothetical protein n=1 Tax=Paracoccus ravus TaxID=2447760 RepID=UPI00106E2B13|nr:hypothetical protein [Paracoccus ravus]